MKIFSVFKAFLAVGLVLTLISDLNAQATHTWISGIGADANPCSVSAPCQTLNGAQPKTTAGGIISVLDPGNFGPNGGLPLQFTVTKAITVDGTSMPSFVDIRTAGQQGITISAGAADVVILRNFVINGLGLGTNGIVFNTGALLVIEDCKIEEFTTAGIVINQSNAGSVVIKNTSINNCPTGISVTNSANVSLSKVSVEGSTVAAIDATAGTVNINDSFITQNSAVGVLGSGTSIISCSNTLFASNNVAIETSATAFISNNDFYDNATTISNSGTVATANNNRVAETTTPGAANSSVTIQ